ncbi:hypothetical protein TWF569_007851 [Orbilia oligospora]|uniref:NADH-ubiquinone oxidoreductase 9.5 kDa subunit n=1 Tax=Orbilia oligospora TaxID=2813651 RepID=A0A4Z0XIZ0_ORBOL|nr:hypothetical protein TWF706_005017 [Orbilia oligospora]KAF3107114.1 hypothetical protein TWF102_000948 [Orbilia oligospora]KAF3108465.1 hypothetical protein TWF103_005546 [Orbilia oligospora]KAF3121902.1 hypothetical protein TWF703_001596 [Orbilia oligospora]KAF3141628.1 hypothetical protein TWF569_007851 [Orbilia oligospora]
MPLLYPRFYRNPFQWARYHAHNNPAIFWSIFVGSWSPVFLFAGQFHKRAPEVPGTYPIPSGKRVIPQGYDDPE